MLSNILCLGVAGNFANHLEQAGESKDFINVEVAEESAPKGIFPFFIPNSNSFLGEYPIGIDKLTLPEYEANAQVEPEVGILFSVEYDTNKKVKELIAQKFTAFNDTTIRKEGAKKISEKKSWSRYSKGIASDWIDIDSFSSGGVMDSYFIKSFVVRDGIKYPYGEDAPLLGYSYFYEKLTTWLVDKLNNQKDFGPLEDIYKIIEECNYPKEIFITIGATEYADFGKNNYLKENDEVLVELYCSKNEGKDIKLHQKVI